jgi:hypothetical protein
LSIGWGTFQHDVCNVCYDCLDNTYSDTWGSRTSKLCPVGKSANTLAAQSCYDIPHEELSDYEKDILALPQTKARRLKAQDE